MSNLSYLARLSLFVLLALSVSYAMGQYSISAPNVSNARVIIVGLEANSGYFIGNLSLPFSTSVNSGPYLAIVFASGYQTELRYFNVTDDQSTSFNVSLQPLVPTTGVLALYSAPSGASVSVQGTGEVFGYSNHGLTPLLLGLPVGTYFANFSAPGYQNLTLHATVAPGQTTVLNATLQPVAISPARGFFVVDSTPAGASLRVLLNGQTLYSGTSPLSVYGVLPGTYVAWATMPGYQPRLAFLRVAADQNTTLHMELRPSN